LAVVWRIFLVAYMAKIILERNTLIKYHLIKLKLRYYFKTRATKNMTDNKPIEVQGSEVKKNKDVQVFVFSVCLELVGVAKTKTRLIFFCRDFLF